MGRKPTHRRSDGRPDPAVMMRMLLAKQRELNSNNPHGEEAIANQARLSKSVNSSAPSAASPNERVKATVNQWRHGVRKLIGMIPQSYVVPQLIGRARFTIDRVYECGEVQATCLIDDRRYGLFIDFNCDKPPAGCSCDDSEGEYPCKHVYAFALHLLSQLQNNQSQLVTTIVNADFAMGEPDRAFLKPDPELLALEELNELISVDGPSLKSCDELPTVQPKAVERVLWHWIVSERTVLIKAMTERENKRGNGFNKAKEISLEKLLISKDLELSPVDRRVVESMARKQQGFGYPTMLTLDPIVVAALLEKAPNVLINHNPGCIESTTFYLGLRLQAEANGKNGWGFVVEDSLGNPLTHNLLSYSDSMLIHHDRSTNRMFYAMIDVKQIRTLINLPRISPKNAEALFQKARQLQATLPLRLPEEVGGPTITETTKPLMLLRSNNNGMLDYGLRVRDSLGRVLKPGMPPAVRPDLVDGKPVQRIRDLKAEVEICQRVAQRLAVASNHSNGWNGSIDDWEQGLRLIENLQNATDEIEVLWEKTSEKPITVLGRLASKNVKVDITSKRDWFGISGICDFGKQTMSLEQLLENLPAGATATDYNGDYVRVADGQWAKISKELKERLIRLRDATHSDRKKLTFDATAAHEIRDLMAGEIEVKATKNWQECLARLSRAELLDPQLPAGLQANLRDYQLDGYKWLRRLAEWGVGGVLADDMGLGKTLQTLAVLLDRRDQGPALVIAPTSVGFNWVREAQRFTPELKTHLYRETDRADLLSGIGPGDLVVCSYGLALRDEESLAKIEWGTLVMDEAQAVKNSRSKTSQAISGFNPKWSVALTGTPVENHLGELWSLFHLVSPGVFGGWDNFRKRFALPIEKHADESARRSLATRLQPFVLRRSKSQVLTELPPRTEMNLYVDLSQDERAQYDRVRLSALGEIDHIAALPSVQDQRFKLLALLTRLRQYACHPGIVNKDWTGSSAKLDQLCETLQELKQEGHRALVFSQFTQHLAVIRQALDRLEISYQYLDGNTPATVRQQRVDAFQNGQGDCFLISLKAGGTGLNLTAADYVIHMDPWWNPAVEDQATDRAHRMGQEKPVMVYRIIARGTIEEEILSLHESKRDLVAGVLEGTGAAGSMSTSELIGMLRGGP
jgi:superfamily II DNA or RNA helicase